MSGADAIAILLVLIVGTLYSVVALTMGTMMVLRWLNEWRLKQKSTYGYAQTPLNMILGLLLAGSSVIVFHQVNSGFETLSKEISA